MKHTDLARNPTLDRRQAMGLALGFAACALADRTNAATKGFFAAHRLPIGLQLYTLSAEAAADLNGCFARIAAIGYRTVELAGFHGHSPKALREAADRAGLRFTGIHVGATARTPSEPTLSGDLPRLAADVHALGIQTVTLPMLPLPEAAAPAAGEAFPAFIARVVGSLGVDAWKRTAALLNDRAAALAKEGLRFSYHNHNMEFAPVGGTTGWDILRSETDPQRVDFEMDVGWVAAAGRDPIELLRGVKGRIRQMHVKDILATTTPNFALHQDPTEVGSGILPWPRLLPAAYDAGVRQFYVEQEPPFSRDRFDAVALSFRYLTDHC
jgi:sugar phosphate isomerase/epimerase